MTDYEIVKPPIVPTMLSVFFLILAAGVAVRYRDDAGHLTTHAAAWATAALGTECCLIGYRLVDRRRRRSAGYTHAAHSGRTVLWCAILGFGIGLWQAYYLALWFAS
jgi:hypothetical protein